MMATAPAKPGLLARLWHALLPSFRFSGQQQPAAKRVDRRPFAVRRYAAAVPNRLTGQMHNGLQDTTGDQEILTDGAALRRVHRNMARNDALVSAIIDKLRRNIIGTRGIWPQVKTDSENLNDEIEMKFRKWSRACGLIGETWAEIQREIANEVITVGEAFVSWSVLDGRVVLQAHESEALSSLSSGVPPTVSKGNQVVAGIEYDSYGRPVNYHIDKVQPGQWGQSYSWVTLPADRVCHIFFRERPTQWRGVSKLSAATITIYDVGSAEYAELTGLRMAASAGIVHKSADGTGMPGIEDADTATSSELDKEIRFEPGMVNTIGPDDELSLIDPTRPGGQFLPFVRSLLNKAAACVGLPSSQITGDYSQTNYSSDRSENIACRPNYEEWQELLIADFCEPMFRAWLQYAVLSGEVRLRGWKFEDVIDATTWQRPGFANVDQEKEAKATLLELTLGLTTLSKAAAERGQDLRELAKQRKADAAMLAEYGIDMDAMIAEANGYPSFAPAPVVASDGSGTSAADSQPTNTQPQAVNQ